MRREYQVVGRKGNAALRQFLAKEGAALVPMVELIEAGQLAVDELVGQLGQATLETVLAISAEQLAGPAHPGRLGERSAGTASKAEWSRWAASRCGCASRDCAAKAAARGRK